MEGTRSMGEQPITISLVASAVINAVSGRKKLLDYGFAFDFNGPHLKEWGADMTDAPTEEMRVLVFEFRNNLTFAKMFKAVPDLRALFFTKNQIGDFLENNASLLRLNAPLFFPLRYNGSFFVVKASLTDANKIRIRVLRFDDECGWLGIAKPRLVVPG